MDGILLDFVQLSESDSVTLLAWLFGIYGLFSWHLSLYTKRIMISAHDLIWRIFNGNKIKVFEFFRVGFLLPTR